MEEQLQILEMLIVNCNKAVDEFMASTKKHDKVVSASKVQEYQNLFCELANENLGVEIVDDNFNFLFNDVGINDFNFYTAIDYLAQVEQKERQKQQAKDYAKWCKENL